MIKKQIIPNKTIEEGKSLSAALLHSKVTLCRAERPKNIIRWADGKGKS